MIYDGGFQVNIFLASAKPYTCVRYPCTSPSLAPASREIKFNDFSELRNTQATANLM